MTGRQKTFNARVALILLACAVSAWAETGARYLVISEDRFVPIVEPLAGWKTRKGMSAMIVPLSEIGSTSSEISSFIRNAWENWTVRPEYVLLVGSPDSLPAASAHSDDGYADMTGDYEIELSIGRFPARTARDCSTLVAKTLLYEKAPFASGDSTWMRRGTTVIREDSPADSFYQPDCRYIRGLWNGAFFAQAESLISYYHDADDARASINEGRGFVVYRGQCVADWYTPFNGVNPSSLTNRDMLPVVVTGSCQTVTLYPGQSMLGDKYVLAGTPQDRSGSVAYFGTANVGSHISKYRGAATRGFFTAVFSGPRWKLGDAAKFGKRCLDSLWPDRTRYEEWTLLGDPELPLWTGRPGLLQAGFDSVIPLGEQDFEIHVTRDGSPLSRALVCVAMGQAVYDTAYTDVNGDATIPVDPRDVGYLSVTVTARNCVPFEDSVPVRATNAPYLKILRCRIDDAQGGNGDGRLNPGETVRLRTMLVNIGDSGAVNVQAVLEAADTMAAVLDSLQNYGNIAAHDSAEALGTCGLSVSSGARDGHALACLLRVRDQAGRTWVAPLSIRVCAGDLRCENVVIDDSPPGGNGDGRLDPAESMRLLVTLRNLGAGSLQRVSARLATLHSSIALTDSISWFGRIDDSSSATDSADRFALLVSPELTAESIWFSLAIQGDGGTYPYARSEQFALVPPTIPGPTGPDAYGYYCYDDTDTLAGEAPIYSWLEIAPPGPGESLPHCSNSDAALDTLRLPFMFRFYGVNFDWMTVASNGFVAFGINWFKRGHNLRIPNDSQVRYAMLWDDLNTDEQDNGHGTVYYYSDTANHRWIVEFHEVAHTWAPEAWETFQLVLLDPAYYSTPTGDGEALFLYDSVGDPREMTVGMQDGRLRRGIEYVYNNTYAPTAAPITPGRALRFTTVLPHTPARDWLTPVAVFVNDSAGGNGNGVAEPGEEIRLTLRIRNRGESTAVAVQGVLRPGDANSVVRDSVADFGDIPVDSEAVNTALPYTAEIANLPADSIAHFALLVSSSGRVGVIYFDLPIASVVGTREGGGCAVRRAELSARPSPTRRMLNVRYAVPRSAHARVALYDVNGRCVQTLLNGQVRPGRYELDWNGTDRSGRPVAGGVYFCRLSLAGRDIAEQLVRKIEVTR